MDLNFLRGVTNNIYLCFLNCNFRTLSWVLLVTEKRFFSCSRNASFHVSVLPAILAAFVRLFKIRKSTFLLFVCPRYNVTWLRPGGHVYNIPDCSVFVSSYSMKGNGSRRWTSRSYTSKNVVWPRRFSALNPSPRSWIFTSVSDDSSPRSYSLRSRVLARLTSLAQIGELARRLQKSRRNHHCHVWYGMVFVLAQELSGIASVNIASFLSRSSKQTERVFQIGVFLKRRLIVSGIASVNIASFLSRSSKQTERVFQIGVFLKRRLIVFVWMDVENGGLRIYDHDFIQHTAHAL